MAEENKTQPQPEQKQAAVKPSGGGSSTTIIIIIVAIIVGLGILGVGGYFGWTYWKNKTKTTTSTTTKTTTPTTTDTNTTTPTTTNTTTPTNNSTTKTTISTDYVISDSNTRIITTTELTNLTPWQLKVARNEIYARHGREFVHKDLQCYFGGKLWYAINPNFTESMLSTTENKNVATIQAYEKSTNSPFQSYDSGC